MGLGKASGKLGRYDDAIASYLEALSIRPDYPFLLHNLGWAYYSRGYYADAINVYKRVTETKPPYPQVAAVYSWVMPMTGPGSARPQKNPSKRL
jgi:tetratricopeptide (TPR) repeat protein